MRRINSNITLIMACLFFLLSGVSGGLAAVDTDADPLTPPVVTGRQLMQEKIDFLMATLQKRLAQIPEADRPALVTGEDFAGVSGLKQLQEAVLDPNHPLHDAVQKAGRLHQDAQTRPELADDANLYLNLAILDALDELLKNPSLTDEIKNTVFALIDLLKELELPEAYQVPDTRFGFTGLGRPDDRDRNDRGDEDPAPGRGFRYYGKPYDLDTDVSVDPRGFIVFADGQVNTASINFGDLNPENNMPAALSPLVGFGRNQGIMVSGGDVEKTDLRYTYRWKAEFAMPSRAATASSDQPETPVMPVMQTSASLYTNDWIVFDYQSQAGGWFFPLLPGIAGLSPGDGGEGSGHPGEEQPRDWDSGAGFMFETLFGGSPLAFGGESYTAIYNGIPGDFQSTSKTGCSLPIVIGDTFFIFRPYEWVENETEDGLTFTYSQTPNKYMVSAGTRSILAGGLASLDEAIGYVADDVGLLQSIDRERNSHNGYGGTFVPGEMSVVHVNGNYPVDWSGYEFGLQTVGQDEDGSPVFFDTPHPLVGPGLDLINGDGFIAYAVQVEEDMVNRKILEMHQEAAASGRISTLMDNINTARGYANIRVRDDWLTRQSDAQAGRVLRDQNGNWVRVQQYVLRPDNNTVQILSASLRDVAGRAELSTLDFTTTFLNDGYSLSSDLRDLPWNSWLNTQFETVVNDDVKYGDVDLNRVVDFKYVVTGEGDPLLDTMSVTIKNPSGQQFQETRTFADEKIPEFNYDDYKMVAVQCVPDSRLKQYITDETLDVSGVGAFENHYYFDSGGPTSADVTFSTLGGPGGFSYNMDGRTEPINVSFYELSGNTAPNGKSDKTFNDFWDALRVNSGGTAPDIGDSSLEIVITDGADAPRFNEFDVVYIPMSRMLWKDKTVEQPNPEA